MKSWTNTEVDFLTRTCNVRPISEIAEFLDRSIVSVNKKRLKLGLGFIPEKRTDIDEDYFNRDSHEMYYVLGLIITDGSLTTIGDKIIIKLKRTDRYVLEYVADQFNYDRSHIKDKQAMRKGTMTYCSLLRINSRKVVASLAQFGLFPGPKTGKEILPLVPDEYKWDLLRQNL